MIAAAPELARRVLDEGHEIGNHTFTHPRADRALPMSKAEEEIQKTQDVFAEVISTIAPPWFRPPYGELRQNQAHLLASRKMNIIFWDVNPADWSQPGVDKITGKILADTQPGSIIVCHD